jgi:hypothetical protein
MNIETVSSSQSLTMRETRQAQSEAADKFAAKQMGIMQEIIQGRNSAQQAFINSHPDTRQAFEGVINELFAAGSSHANEAARIAATVQDMRNAQKAYRDT